MLSPPSPRQSVVIHSFPILPFLLLRSLLTSLKELFITDNLISSLPEGFCHLSSLVKLQASFNSLESIPEALGDLPRLELMRVRALLRRSSPRGEFRMLALTSHPERPMQGGCLQHIEPPDPHLGPPCCCCCCYCCR